jgi:hypothetical protein
LAKVAVSFSADTFVVTESSVLRINICGENRHLRKAAKTLAFIVKHDRNKKNNKFDRVKNHSKANKNEKSKFNFYPFNRLWLYLLCPNRNHWHPSMDKQKP